MDIDIIYRSGRLHVDADVLSRHPIGPPGAEVEIPMLLCQPAFLSLPGSLNISQLQQDSNWWRKIIVGLKNPNPDCSTRRKTRNFLLINDVLYHRVVFRGRASQQLCFPPELVNQVLLACHDDITAGHLGVSRTLFKVNQRFFWPKRTQEVTHYVPYIILIIIIIKVTCPANKTVISFKQFNLRILTLFDSALILLGRHRKSDLGAL